MAEQHVYDFSFAHADPASLKAAGAAGVMRYLAYRNPSSDKKILGPAEAEALWAAGLPVGLVWETTAARMLGGAESGRLDGIEANRQAALLGFPLWVPIAYALDQQPVQSELETCSAYLTAGTQEGRPARFYGGITMGDALVTARIVDTYWQTEAWSGSAISKHACLYQRVKATKPIPGTDENLVLRPDWGGWMPGMTPAPPKPEPVPATSQEDDMPKFIFSSQTPGPGYVTWLEQGVPAKKLQPETWPGSPEEMAQWLIDMEYTSPYRDGTIKKAITDAELTAITTV